MNPQEETHTLRRNGRLSPLRSALCLLLGAFLGAGCDVPWHPGPPEDPGHGPGKPGPRPGACPLQPPEKPPTLEAYASSGPYGFAVREFVFIDSSRPTPPNGEYPGSPVRTLPTRVYYPACPPDTAAGVPTDDRIPVARGGPFPLLANAHGLTALGEARIGEHLASHGYVLVAPRFPLSSGVAPGGPTVADIANQPADLAFVMRQVALLSGADADLAAAVDTQRRGILGFSAGGETVLIGAYHPILALDGIQAAVAQAPAVACLFGPPFYARPLPTLIIAGTSDELVPITDPEKAFSLAPPPVILMKLLGGTHSGFLNREIPFVTNSDTALCQQLLESGATMTGREEFAEDIIRGVGPGAIDPTACEPLCSQSFVQTMGATRQQSLNYAATLAHFEATLRN
ncbi:MAG TPA: hypothetical protein VLQ93_13865, partial [Myxococcaceae bacterium]|nr:hypothetical protein [Myxococcaceae bacterium]